MPICRLACSTAVLSALLHIVKQGLLSGRTRGASRPLMRAEVIAVAAQHCAPQVGYISFAAQKASREVLLDQQHKLEKGE